MNGSDFLACWEAGIKLRIARNSLERWRRPSAFGVKLRHLKTRRHTAKARRRFAAFSQRLEGQGVFGGGAREGAYVDFLTSGVRERSPARLTSRQRSPGLGWTMALEKTVFSNRIARRSSRVMRLPAMPRPLSSRAANFASTPPSSISAPLPPENRMRALGSAAKNETMSRLMRLCCSAHCARRRPP
jgi:hypothetical protein